MATEQIPTTLIADDAVTNAKIGADAVSTTEIANDASISTSGNIATTGSGTLTVAGTSTLTGALTASGGIANSGTITAGTLGSSVTVQAGSPIAVTLARSASSSTTSYVDFNNTVITDSYSAYRIIFNLVIPATDVTEPLVQVSINNGSSFLSTIDNRRVFHQLNTSSSHGQEHDESAYIRIGTDLGNDADQGWGGYVDLFGLRSTSSHYAFAHADCMGKHGTAHYWWDNGHRIYKGGSTAINFLRCTMSGGDFSAHDISLIGFK